MNHIDSFDWCDIVSDMGEIRREVGILCESSEDIFGSEVAVKTKDISDNQISGFIDESFVAMVDGKEVLIVVLDKEEGEEALVILPGRGAFIQASSIRVPKSSVVELPGWDKKLTPVVGVIQ